MIRLFHFSLTVRRTTLFFSLAHIHLSSKLFINTIGIVFLYNSCILSHSTGHSSKFVI